jgi:hypothetical protein
MSPICARLTVPWISKPWQRARACPGPCNGIALLLTKPPASCLSKPLIGCMAAATAMQQLLAWPACTTKQAIMRLF